MRSQHAIVAGAAMGIGAAIARKLYAAGFSVTLLDRAADEAAKFAAELGADAHAFAADATKPEQLAAAAEQARAHAGGAPILAAVNSVGVYDERRPLLKTDLAGFNRMIEVNLTSAFLFSQAFVPLLAANASVVHIGSVNGQIAGMEMGAYKIAKAGLNMLVRCLALELGREPRRIRVNAVNPGWVDTPGERRVQAAHGRAGILDDPGARGYIPLNRLTLATEIADTVAFLCGPGGSAITGQLIYVDCGITIGEITPQVGK